MSRYIEVLVFIDTEHQEFWIAQLYQLGIENFVEEQNVLKAYLDPELWKLLEENLTLQFKLAALKFEVKDLESQDWNALWESNFDPIRIDDLLYVRATFHPILADVEHEIVIAPKMAFGTGHHSTTFMKLRWMSSRKFDQLDVLDFGCGTGILGIYAKLKNCRTLTLIDNDEAAIENSTEHCALNHVVADEILLGSLDVLPDKLFHVMLANITRNVLENCLPTLLKHLRSEGSIVISGFLEEDKEIMCQILSKEHIVIQEIMQDKDWIAIEGKKK